MTSPIGGNNFTDREIAELKEIWGNLPTADPATLKADINKLTQLAKAHPDDAGLQSAIASLTMSGYADTSAAEFNIANDLYSSLPNIMPSSMTQELNALMEEFNAHPNNLSASKINQALTQLQGLLVQAQNMQPPSPQSQIIINRIQAAIEGVQQVQGGTWDPFSSGLSDAADAIASILPVVPPAS